MGSRQWAKPQKNVISSRPPSPHHKPPEPLHPLLLVSWVRIQHPEEKLVLDGGEKGLQLAIRGQWNGLLGWHQRAGLGSSATQSEIEELSSSWTENIPPCNYFSFSSHTPWGTPLRRTQIVKQKWGLMLGRNSCGCLWRWRNYIHILRLLYTWGSSTQKLL